MGGVQWTIKADRHRDFAQVRYAARAVLAGVDPYTVIGPGRPFAWDWPLYYPLPAALVALPLAPFAEPLAMSLFVAIGFGLFAWALTARAGSARGLPELWRLELCDRRAVVVPPRRDVCDRSPLRDPRREAKYRSCALLRTPKSMGSLWWNRSDRRCVRCAATLARCMALRGLRSG